MEFFQGKGPLLLFSQILNSFISKLFHIYVSFSLLKISLEGIISTCLFLFTVFIYSFSFSLEISQSIFDFCFLLLLYDLFHLYFYIYLFIYLFLLRLKLLLTTIFLHFFHKNSPIFLIFYFYHSFYFPYLLFCLLKLALKPPYFYVGSSLILFILLFLSMDIISINSGLNTDI